MNWFGLGKSRTKFGRWIDEKGIRQEDIQKRSGLSDETISRAANKDDWKPSWKTRKRIMDAVNEIDEDKTTRDFW